LVTYSILCYDVHVKLDKGLKKVYTNCVAGSETY